jgi:uncharacterized protein (TIGR03435 family)
MMKESVPAMAVASFLCLAACLALGQPAAGPVGFDVASVKPSQLAKTGVEGSRRDSIDHTPTSLTMRNVNLSTCIEYAYGVKFYQVTGPGWLVDDRYDIVAKTSAPVPLDQLKRMLQPLLAARFRLALHREAKPFSVYEMVIAKNGPKLHEAAGDAKSELWVSGGAFVFHHTSTSELAERLSGLAGMDRPIIDKTGIRGAFDITLASLAEKVRQGDSAAIFDAVEEQLGLKLVPARTSIEVLVVDHAERVPVEN